MAGSLSTLVHGPSKTGKSTLASTSPTPILVFDAEGGWQFIKEAGFKSGAPLRRTTWDPTQGPPPRHDGTWDVCVVTVQRWDTLTKAYSWLTQAPHDFVSLILDSITEVQRRLKFNLKGTEQMKIQDWGSLLVLMDSLIRGMRDLVHVPNTTLRLVMFISETRESGGKWRPYMQGQIAVSLPYWVDICGYVFQEQEINADGQPTEKVLKLLVAQHPQYEAGERVQGVLGDIVRKPHMSTILKTVFGDAVGHNSEGDDQQ